MHIITSALIASQSISPFYINEYSLEINSQFIARWIGEVRRVYCSSKSLGFDLHFNSRSGQLYSFNEFSNRLEPFKIESEIPFPDTIPYVEVDDFLLNWRDVEMTIDTNISNGNLLIKMYAGINPQDYVIASLNLSSLKININIKSQYSERKDQIIANQVARQIKCEYIEPESYKL